MARSQWTTGQALRQLLSVARQDPIEAWDRIGAQIDVRLDRYRRNAECGVHEDWQSFVASVGRTLSEDLSAFLVESRLSTVRRDVIENLRTIDIAAFPQSASGDVALGTACYLLCRALKPLVVVETGVLYGATAAFILAALAENGRGVLHSIDLPPLRPGQDDMMGHVVATELRDRWYVHRGASKRMLPRVVAEVEHVDVFVHDSLHTFRNVCREFRQIQGRLSPGAALVCDDVEVNGAFDQRRHRSDVRYSAIVRQEQKDSAFGVCLLKT